VLSQGRCLGPGGQLGYETRGEPDAGSRALAPSTFVGCVPLEAPVTMMTFLELILIGRHVVCVTCNHHSSLPQAKAKPNCRMTYAGRST